MNNISTVATFEQFYSWTKVYTVAKQSKITQIIICYQITFLPWLVTRLPGVLLFLDWGQVGVPYKGNQVGKKYSVLRGHQVDVHNLGILGVRDGIGQHKSFRLGFAKITMIMMMKNTIQHPIWKSPDNAKK